MDEVYGDIVHIEKAEGLEPGEGLGPPPDPQEETQDAKEQARFYHPTQSPSAVSEADMNDQGVAVRPHDEEGSFNEEGPLNARKEGDSSEDKEGADADEDARALVPAVRRDYRLLRRNRELDQLRMCFSSCKLALYTARRVLSIIDGKGDVLK
jgi:hypothetical protein